MGYACSLCVTILFTSNSLHTEMQFNFILHISYNVNETIILSQVQTKNNGKAIIHIQNFCLNVMLIQN